MRLNQAVRELNDQGGAPMTTVALFTDPDQKAMFVREADFAVSLGPVEVVDPRERTPQERVPRPRAAGARAGGGAGKARADAVRAGWGFVSEREELAELCARMGITFIGPSPAAIRRLTDKVSARRAAEEALLPTVFLEQRAAGMHHLEVPFMGDHHDNAWGVGVHEHTLQRRSRNVLEEAPTLALSIEQHRELCDAAARLARHVGYAGAGTVEVVYDPRTRSFAFVAAHARLPMEHAAIEAVTGLDLVKLELHVARGGRLEGEPPPPRGHAFEVHLDAEDPDDDFAPAPGRVELLRLPTGPGLRVDCGVTGGRRRAARLHADDRQGHCSIRRRKPSPSVSIS